MDRETCWLNSCLQLLLTGLDHTDSALSFTSELGNELLKLKYQNDKSLDPTTTKNIIVATEDMRIASRLSELAAEIDEPVELERRTVAVKKLRLNLLTGQQCVRDFFVCLEENLESWIDIYLTLKFTTTRSSTCLGCNMAFNSENVHIYLELDVPQDDSNLNDYLEEYFNISTLVGQSCSDGCKKFNQMEKSLKITLVDYAEFFVIVLTRAVLTQDGWILNKNRITSTNDVSIR